MPSRKTLLLSITALLLACTNNTVYHTFRHIGGDGWWRNDTVCFNLPPTDIVKSCQINLEMRVTPQFPYTTLYIQMEETWEGKTVRRDTIEYTFTDNSGELNGHGIILLQYKQPAGNITLRPDEKGEIRLTHLMERETIPQIYDIGVRMGY